MNATSGMNLQWVLRQRPIGTVRDGDLEARETPIPSPSEGEVLVRSLYLSLNPTHRLWMSARDQYMPPVGLGEVMRGGGLGVVESSRSPRYKAGDIVSIGMGRWEAWSALPAETLSHARPTAGVPLTACMSVLGGTGLTAYFGMMEVARPTVGETVVVTAAAGAVGSIAGQIAQIAGARVIGVCGGAAKCSWLTEELGFAGAIDYRNDDVPAALDRFCPRGIDVDFENVGGAVMDQILARMNNFGRVALCGLISTYNADGPVPGPSNFDLVLMRRLRIEGFIISDYFPRAREAYERLAQWVLEGRIRWKDHVVEGLENAPQALGRLFSGDHDGKLLVRVSPEP